MIRVVFDTNVLYSAILKRTGHEARAFDLVAAGLIIPCVSDTVLTEYRDVLFRPELAAHVGRARLVVDLLSGVALHVTPTETLGVSDHEEDNRIYECAAAAQAHYIVTGNKKHFPQHYQMTQIVNARELLSAITVA